MEVIGSRGNREIINLQFRVGKVRCQIHHAYPLPPVRAQAHHGLSSASCVGRLLRAARALLPLCEALRLPAFALVSQLGATSELEIKTPYGVSIVGGERFP